MNEISKVLHMAFTTAEGGTFKIALKDTREDLTPVDIKQVMNTIVDAGVFETSKGEVVRKANAYYLTQEVEKLDID